MSDAYDEVQAAAEVQRSRAKERFAQSESERAETTRLRGENGTGVHDTIERLQARAERLVSRNETPADVIIKVAEAPASDKRLALERIINLSNELQSWTFLPRGVRAANPVARISSVSDGRELPLGTGSLVSPRLLMTNNHVLPTAEAAAGVVVEFAAELDVDNHPQVSARYQLDPATFFVTDDHLDVSLVLVAPDAEGKSAGERFGFNQLVRETGKIVTGEAVNVIGHPSGRLKEIAIRENHVDLVLDDFLHYSTDTEPGNSGSPVFNDQWEVVALHHAGVSKQDDQGRVLRKDGKLWQNGDGDDAIDWIANEGVRVSSIVKFFAGAAVGAEQAAILAELGAAAGVAVGGGPVVAGPDEAVPIAVAPLVDGVPTQREKTQPGKHVGLPGRSNAGVNLVFLHGRHQQGKDPQLLRLDWAAGLNAGLTRAQMPPLDPTAAWFPFYGDKLAEVLEARESLARTPDASVNPSEAVVNPAESLAPPEGDPAREIYEELIDQAAKRSGMPSATEAVAADESLGGIAGALVGKLQKQLSWVSKSTGLDDRIIALVFADVAAYLGRDRVRQTVLDTVLETWPTTGPVVLVSHSLGTVVAMDLISQLGDKVELPLLVTAGSPLGMDAVYKRLLDKRLRRPAQAHEWVNAWCRPDAVSIGCPLAPVWGDGVVDVLTDNPEDRAHSIAEYLSDERVAGRIGAVLAGRLVH
jgi:endonuclease G, mitochondrial